VSETISLWDIVTKTAASWVDHKDARLGAALDRLLERGTLRIETLKPGTTREQKVLR
jgi:hypothetical protein